MWHQLVSLFPTILKNSETYQVFEAFKYMCLQMLRSHCRLDDKDTYRDPVSEEKSLKRYKCYRYERAISSQSGAAISFLGWTNFLFLQKCVALLAQKCLFKVTCHFKMIFDQSAAIPASILSLVIGSQRLFIYRLWGTFTALSPFWFTILKKFLLRHIGQLTGKRQMMRGACGYGGFGYQNAPLVLTYES